MSTVNGFAWLVYPTDPDDLDADNHPLWDATHQLDDPLPDDVLYFDYVTEESPGITINPSGANFLIITGGISPPHVRAGWSVEPANIELGFVRDDEAIRLIQITGLMGTPIGEVTRGVFEVVEEAGPDE